MSAALTVLLASLIGAAGSSVLACLPGLHVYNLMGLLVVFIHWLAAAGHPLPPEATIPFMAAMIVGWSILNTIPSIILGAPDESAIFTVLPGQKYLMFGRGFEGTMMTGIGSLAGVFLLIFGVGPLAPRILPIVQTVLRPYMGWILWVIITFILMSEWPKGGNVGPAGWRKFLDAWKSLGAGLATFFLAALLGFILLYRPPIASEMAFQNIMPAFVGLFAIPWCLLNLISGAQVPPQHVGDSVDVDPETILRSVAAGGLGGGFAAFFPVVTGGVGGLLAGHATAQRDERVFIMSQGVSKVIYYTGAFMLMFVPGLGLTRGGGAWIVRGLFTPRTWGDYYMVMAAIALAGAVSFLLMGFLTRGTIRLVARVNYRYVSAAALAIIILLVFAVTRWSGLAVMLVGTGIGLIPVLFASRRLNCLGILLFPIACNMTGIGPDIARFLGLI
ncbi:MAG: tripartite tricarboxylate transporter permease [Candidatus Marinimicrobia bacterium]|nr:tripartite tricarboxylate transporter permease [Candidatus Neomarinimicrobiota bacterium]